MNPDLTTQIDRLEESIQRFREAHDNGGDLVSALLDLKAHYDDLEREVESR